MPLSSSNPNSPTEPTMRRISAAAFTLLMLCSLVAGRADAQTYVSTTVHRLTPDRLDSLKALIAAEQPAIEAAKKRGGIASVASGQDSLPYRNLSTPSYEVVTDFEVKVPMRDGVRLAANIVRPKAPGRYPVVVSYYPYGKEAAPYFAQRGYVAVFAEGRGTGTSEGVMADYFDAQSFRDGYDLVEWAAAQKWSTGKVGMTGISYGAINATRVAALRPPHLAAISVNSSYANFYGDHWFPGGVRSNHPYVWHGATNVLSTMLRGPVYDDGRGGKVVDLERWKRHQVENKWEGFFMPQWEHTSYDAYWREKDLRSKYADFAVPTLQFANYFDHARNHDEAYQNYQILKAKNVPQKLVVGPWTHGGFGPSHVVDFALTTVAWFDRFLKGFDNGITREPPITLFVMRENRWRNEEEWPIARTVPTTMYLGADGGLTPSVPDRAGPPRRFTYRPWVGSAAGPYGTWFDAAYGDFLVQPDQRVDEAESLTFTSAPLTDDVETTGMAEISFLAASSATTTDFTIKLSDVLPDGRSELVTRGWINSSYRESNVNPRLPSEWRFVEPTPIVAGQPYRFRVTLQNIAYLFQRGHRVRVTIASSDWPSSWPNAIPAENEIRFEELGRGGASFIVLPVVPARSVPLALPRLALLPDRPRRTPAAGDSSRIWIEQDLTGKSVIYRSVARSEDPVPGGTMRELLEWRIDLSKEAPYRQVIDLIWTQTLVRSGQRDVRFVYRVRTDDKGPKARVEFGDAVIP